MNETIKTLTSRKSVAKFDGTHITKEELATILSAGLNAPSGMNFQDALFIAIQDEETVATLSRLNREAAVAMNPAAETSFPADPFYGSKDVIAVVTKKVMTSVYDGSLAMGNLLNAAYSLGVGCRWIHRAKEVFETTEGKAILAKAGITEEVEGIGFCILGHTSEEKPQTEIKPNRVFYI